MLAALERLSVDTHCDVSRRAVIGKRQQEAERTVTVESEMKGTIEKRKVHEMREMLNL